MVCSREQHGRCRGDNYYILISVQWLAEVPSYWERYGAWLSFCCIRSATARSTATNPFGQRGSLPLFLRVRQSWATASLLRAIRSGYACFEVR